MEKINVVDIPVLIGLSVIFGILTDLPRLFSFVGSVVRRIQSKGLTLS